MISDAAAVALAIERVRTTRSRSSYPAEAIAEIEAALEELRALRAENEDLRAQLDAAIRRVPARCAGPRCEGRGVYYPGDGELTCIWCVGR